MDWIGFKFQNLDSFEQAKLAIDLVRFQILDPSDPKEIAARFSDYLVPQVSIDDPIVIHQEIEMDSEESSKYRN